MNLHESGGLVIHDGCDRFKPLLCIELSSKHMDMKQSRLFLLLVNAT